MTRGNNRWAKQDARHRVAISTVAAILTWFVLDHHIGAPSRAVATWDVFALSALVLGWLAILNTPHEEVRRHAREQDPSHFFIFVFVVIAACASVFAVVLLFVNAKGGHTSHLPLHIAISVVAILSAWALVHTVFGLRYAHVFYGDNPDDKRRHIGGLDFPGERLPDYMDFAYFAFVIGMTFQVSDVQVTSRRLRQLVLLHGILSFAFNTIILALTINTVSSLL